MEDDTAASLSSLLAPHFEDYQQTEAKSELDLQRRVKAIQKEIEKYNNSAHQGEKPVSKESKQKGKKKSSAAASGTNENASLALLHFFECVISAPLLSENKVGADNVLELTAEVAVASGNDITELVLQRAMEFTNVLLERARCVACRFIGFLVKALMNKEVPKDDLLDKASQVLLPRFTDKSQAVRQAAVEAGQYFFKGSSTDPDIMQATLFIVQHDPSVANRIAALESLPVNLETLDALLSRVRDVKSKVRSSALEVLLENNSQIWDAVLHSEHFATLVESGCTDRYVIFCYCTHHSIRF